MYEEIFNRLMNDASFKAAIPSDTACSYDYEQIAHVIANRVSISADPCKAYVAELADLADYFS